MASFRTESTSSGVISGSGLAMAKMIGFFAIVATSSGVSAPFTERPMNTSAPTRASARVRWGVAVAWADFHWFISSVRPCQSTPLRSTAITLEGVTPMALISSSVAIPAAPGPFRTTFTSARFRPVMAQAFMSPAAVMMAVPCWSSWNTGMSRSSWHRCSMMKHSGLLMSSRLMPPKVEPMARTTVTISSASLESTSMSMESTSAKRLKRMLLPSITGFDAKAPRSPSPRMAVPLEITATMLPFDV